MQHQTLRLQIFHLVKYIFLREPSTLWVLNCFQESGRDIRVNNLIYPSTKSPFAHWKNHFNNPIFKAYLLTKFIWHQNMDNEFHPIVFPGMYLLIIRVITFQAVYLNRHIHSKRKWMFTSCSCMCIQMVIFTLNGVWRSVFIKVKTPGPRLNIKTVLSMYGDFHVKDKTAVRTSYL